MVARNILTRKKMMTYSARIWITVNKTALISVTSGCKTEQCCLNTLRHLNKTDHCWWEFAALVSIVEGGKKSEENGEWGILRDQRWRWSKIKRKQERLNKMKSKVRNRGGMKQKEKERRRVKSFMTSSAVEETVRCGKWIVLQEPFSFVSTHKAQLLEGR